MLRRTSLVVSRREGGEVVYSVSVPEVRDLLLAARRILSGLIDVQDDARAAARDPARAAMTGLRRRSGVVAATVAALLPRATDWTHVRPRRDLVAGLTVGLVALPLALGFGVSSGLGAGAGLVTAIVAGASRPSSAAAELQVSGPTGAMTVVLVPIVPTLRRRRRAGGRAARRASSCSGSGTRGPGATCATSRCRSSRASRSGIAAIIALQQVPAALGVDVHAEQGARAWPPTPSRAWVGRPAVGAARR